MGTKRTRTTGACVACAAALLLAGAGSATAAMPITQEPSDLPTFIGHAAQPDPLTARVRPPRHPHMAPNELSNLHDDAYQTDAYVTRGPLGRDSQTLSTQQIADCGSVTFDSKGRIVTICVGLTGPILRMLDPHTLDELASMVLPPRQPGTGSIFTDFAGGGYFYLDDKDQAVFPTTSRHVFVVSETSGPGFKLEHDYDLTGAVPQGDKIISALPDWSGRIWFASINGVVGTVDPGTGAIKSKDTGEPIGNSIAVDETGGVYIVSDKAMYRFDAAADGSPAVTWRETYANVGIAKPGQSEKGSGTTPTVMQGGYVAITDNADPMNVLVYKKAKDVKGSRLICTQPVFKKGESNTDQSLIVFGRSIIAENNYGYSGPTATEQGGTTSPGIERVDLNHKGNGCRSVWRSDERAPSVVPKLSLGNGLVYSYTKGTQSSDPWYLTAIDFRTGDTKFKFRVGNGLGFNNNYAPVTIGPDGTAYVGTLGGLTLVRDQKPPSTVDPVPPRLRLSLKHLKRGRLRARLEGDGTQLVTGVDYRAAGHKAARHSSKLPFKRSISQRRLGSGKAYVLSARVKLEDGRKVVLKKRFKRR